MTCKGQFLYDNKTGHKKYTYYKEGNWTSPKVFKYEKLIDFKANETQCIKECEERAWCKFIIVDLNS